MGNFQGDRNRGGGGGYRGGNNGGRPSFGGRDRDGRGGGKGPVTMHKAVCDECHKPCEVPFRPSSDKPIYCNECFGSKKGADDRGPRRPSFGDREPRRDFGGAKPQSSFSKPVPVPVSDDTKKQLGEINAKLDRLISILEKNNSPKVEAKSIPVSKATEKKVEKKVIEKKVINKKIPAKKAVKKAVTKKKVK